MEDGAISTQMAMDVAMTKKTLDFEASMHAELLNGSFEKAAELQANLSRNAGLAAQGIGVNLSITV